MKSIDNNEVKRNIELANLTIRFGEFTLLDKFEEYFFPALVDQRVRGRGETESYRFHKLKVTKLNGESVLVGRFFKIQNIRAEQVFNEIKEELEPSQAQMRVAPSSLFVITLSNHKVAFMREVSRAPSIKNLQYAFGFLLNKQWRLRYEVEIERVKAEKKNTNPRGKKRKEIYDLARERSHEPYVDITPLVEIQQLNKHLDAFAQISSIEIKAKKTNNERAGLSKRFLQNLSREHEQIRATTTKVVMQNGSDGLDKNETKNLLKNTADGNYEVKMKGVSSEGEKLSGDSTQFSVAVTAMIQRGQDILGTASQLLEGMKNAIERRRVAIAPNNQDDVRKASEIVRRANDE